MSYSIETDRKWQKIWEEKGANRFDGNLQNKLYCLEMFSYPSGAKLHVGHWYNFGLADIWARVKGLQGYNVFHPQGFDAFGLPAENYAIKTGVHPKDSTYANIEVMQRQVIEMGASYDWDYKVVTSDPEYYKWTQWLFLKLFDKGLAYRAEAPVNWCPSCKTVLANEQVIGGHCERCESEVRKEKRTQWFFKITDYAEELLQKLDGLDWPEKTKKIQRNWIGRSEGAEISFKVKDCDKELKVFTTRADTLFGATFLAVAPESEIVPALLQDEYKVACEQYIESAKRMSEIDRLSAVRERTGVFTGLYAGNPATGVEVPVWIADYVIGSYGTGSVMGVPAHDERDYDFALRMGLPVVQVVKGEGGTALPYTGEGRLINSGCYDGLDSEAARGRIVDDLAQSGRASRKVQYRLRDWLVSRQRYWGAPIPVVYCEECGIVPIPYDSLPVELPYDVSFKPDGESPLATCPEFVNTYCPHCGKLARRETDTLDTFVDSSWYFLRYPDNRNTDEAFDTALINKMLPVDMYVGGAEHATMHLLYARFMTKALRDVGYLGFDEPFRRVIHQGTILGADGNKMSKSKGNTVTPDDYVEQYGADVFRLYLAFGFAFADGGIWKDEGIAAIRKFVTKVEALTEKVAACTDGADDMGKREKSLNQIRYRSILAVSEDVEKFQFNTCIARLMELRAGLEVYCKGNMVNHLYLQEVMRDFVILIASFAPHFGEELWEKLGGTDSVFKEKWPQAEVNALIQDTVEIVIQVNGRVKWKEGIRSGLPEEELKAIILNNERVLAYIAGKAILKTIVVRDKLINIVLK